VLIFFSLRLKCISYPNLHSTTLFPLTTLCLLFIWIACAWTTTVCIARIVDFIVKNIDTIIFACFIGKLNFSQVEILKKVKARALKCKRTHACFCTHVHFCTLACICMPARACIQKYGYEGHNIGTLCTSNYQIVYQCFQTFFYSWHPAFVTEQSVTSFKWYPYQWFIVKQ